MMCLAFAVALSVAAPAASSLDSVVAAHYPPFLAAQSALHRYADEKHQSYVEDEISAIVEGGRDSRFMVTIGRFDVSPVTLGASPQAETIVAKAFPESLVAENGLRQYAYATGTINGESIIAAAYSNGEFGALSILTPEGRPVTTIAPDNFLGEFPEVKLIDVDGDGQPEVVVVMNQARGLPATWIYRFANHRLTLLGPLHGPAESPETELADVQFLRTDSTNRVSLLDRHTARWSDDRGTEHATETLTLYTWNGTGFGAGQPVDVVANAERGRDGPQTSTTTFAMDAVPVRRTLLLVNGDVDGEHRASRVSVRLNGEEVIGEKNLNRTIAAVRVPVTLKRVKNQVTLTVKSDPGSQVTVLVLPALH